MENFTNPDREYERDMVSRVLDLKSFKLNDKGTVVPFPKLKEDNKKDEK